MFYLHYMKITQFELGKTLDERYKVIHIDGKNIHHLRYADSHDYIITNAI